MTEPGNVRPLSPEHDLDEIVSDLVSSYRLEVEPFVGSDEADPYPDLGTLAERNATIILGAVEERRRLTDLELGVLREIERRPFAERLHVHDVVRLHNVAPRIIQRHLLKQTARSDRRGEGRIVFGREVTDTVLAISSQIRASLFADRLPKGEPPVRMDGTPDVVAELLTGWVGSTGAFRQRAQAAGIVLGDAHVVVVVAPGGRRADEATTAGLHALGGAFTPRAPITGFHEGRAVAIVPVEGDDTPSELALATDAALRATGPAGNGLVGAVGQSRPSVFGIRESYAQAVRVLDVVGGDNTLPSVMTYDEALPYLVLTHDPGIAVDLVSTLRPLVEADNTEHAQLLPTLEAILACPGNITRASQVLGVHRKTVYDRLARIEALTGKRVDVPTERVHLDLAVHAMRLLPPHRLHTAG